MMTTPLAAASMTGFQTLFGTLPITAELSLPGTFLGVGPEQYRTAEGAAQAIESAYVLGLEARWGILLLMVTEDVDEPLDDYVAAVRENDWARAGSIQRRLAEKVRGYRNWAREIARVEKMPAWQLLFTGGIFATRPFPLHTPVRGNVYSNPALIPRGIQDRYARAISIAPFYFDAHTRQESMDVRGLRPLHHLTEGRATELIAAKYRKMMKELTSWKRRQPADWQQRRDEILLALTRGDKHATADRIKVGEYFPRRDKQPRYLLLNGHRRIATLCLLGANGEIPLDWLLHIPVEVYFVRTTGDFFFEMTAWRHLGLEQVLADVTIDGLSPAAAISQLNKTSPCDRRDRASPLSLVHLDDLDIIDFQDLMFLATSQPEDPLWQGILEFVRNLRVNSDPHWSSVLYRWPGLIAVRFLFSAYRNETATAFREEIENALRRTLLEINRFACWDSFVEEGHWPPEDLVKMKEIMFDEPTP